MIMNVRVGNLSLYCLVTALPIGAPAVLADTVETKDGARLVGKITGITENTIALETVYAGSLRIKKAEVVGFSTEDPLVIRLASGTTMSGKVTHSGGSRMEIAGSDGVLTTEMPKIAASWALEGEDSAVIKMRDELEDKRRKWSYEVGLDITGKSGNSEESGTAARMRATLAGPDDSLGLYLSYDQAEKNGGKTSNEIIAGATYDSFFKEKLGWFVRSEIESDEFEDVDIRVTVAGGLSYRFINQEKHTLGMRAGFGYRFEGLENGNNIEAPSLDLGLKHFYQFNKFGRVTTVIKFIPSVEDFSDFRLSQDTGFEFPLGAGGSWKLRMGISNFFNNNPAPGREELDTTYYSRLIFSWDSRVAKKRHNHYHLDLANKN